MLITLIILIIVYIIIVFITRWLNYRLYKLDDYYSIAPILWVLPGLNISFMIIFVFVILARNNKFWSWFTFKNR